MFVVSTAHLFGKHAPAALRDRDPQSAFSGLSSIMSEVMNQAGFHPAQLFNSNNAVALNNTVAILANPDSFRLKTTGESINPFSLARGRIENFAFNLNYPNWKAALIGITDLYGELVPEDKQALHGSIQDMVHTAASHPNNGGQSQTLFHHVTFRLEPNYYMTTIYTTSLDVEAVAKKHKHYVLTHLWLNRAVFTFDIRKWQRLAPQYAQGEQVRFTQLLNRLKTPKGSRPMNLCLD